MAITTGDTVTVEYTGRVEDGSVFDTSREAVAEEVGLAERQPDRDFEPLTVEIGAGRIIDGLTEVLIGMENGAETTVRIPPENAYGERQAEQIEDYDADEFTQRLGESPTEGMPIEIEDRGRGYVVYVDSDVIRVDFNHQLAGESIEFDIEILEVQ